MPWCLMPKSNIEGRKGLINLTRGFGKLKILGQGAEFRLFNRTWENIYK